ncbi:uncharacterized protein LOC113372304 [Ctenocephalides felis]|uniref:uncharacterized protein LOC113372304 n=1 Tax=Ctenocephalides felis TaxID=7515 RepID=UPI000E6E4872|nr:uncharacterized protein LOC113372304 [Ctenocephalides felis]XP_026468413.1 uncharacterized protein LOC113372304 [Ctenocephalides felis]
MNTNTNNPSGTDTFTGRVISDHTIITNQVPVTVPHPVVYHLQVTKPLSAVYQAQPVQFRQVAVPVLQVQQVQQQYPLLVTKRYSNPADNNPIQGHFFVKAVPASQLDFAHGTGFIGTAYDGYGRTDQNLGTIQVLNN